MSIALEKFDQAVISGKATWWQMSLPSGKVFFGDAKTEMLGYEASDFNTYQDFTAILHPEDFDQAMLSMKNHLDGKTPFYNTSYRIRHKQGHYIQFYDCGKIINQQDGLIDIIGFVWKIDPNQDISQQALDIQQLILGGHPSMIDLISSIKSTPSL